MGFLYLLFLIFDFVLTYRLYRVFYPKVKRQVKQVKADVDFIKDLNNVRKDFDN